VSLLFGFAFDVNQRCVNLTLIWKDYWDLAQYAGHVTVFADSRDQPAQAATTASQFTNLSDEIFSKQSTILTSLLPYCSPNVAVPNFQRFADFLSVRSQIIFAEIGRRDRSH
jgi:hypothetical protein